MKFYLSFAALLLVVIGTNSQDFDLFDALDPTDAPAVSEKPKENTGDLDLWDALGPDLPDPEPTKARPKKPADGELDLWDAVAPEPNPNPNPKPKPDRPVPPQTGGGGGTFDDSDLFDVGKGDYKPEGGGAGAKEPNYHGDGGGGGGGENGKPQEAGAGQIAGIASAVGMALVGAASSYFAYQKKKLCFKLQGGADPESGKNYQGGNHTQPQLLSNLLRTS